MLAVPPSAPFEGTCARLSAWTPGAAIAAIDSPAGLALRAFGDAPKTVPVPTPRGAKQQKTCATLVDAYVYFAGFPGGELVAIGPTCSIPSTRIERWAPGAARSVTADAAIDPDAPYSAERLSPEELILDGAGAVPGSKVELMRGGKAVESLLLRSRGVKQAFVMP